MSGGVRETRVVVVVKRGFVHPAGEPAGKAVVGRRSGSLWSTVSVRFDAELMAQLTKFSP